MAPPIGIFPAVGISCSSVEKTIPHRRSPRGRDMRDI